MRSVANCLQSEMREGALIFAVRRALLRLACLSVFLLLFAAAAQAQCGSCGCPAGQDCYCSGVTGFCSCVPGTPILIGLDGDGLTLTNPGEGVLFDFFLSGGVQIAWTQPQADEGWLVLPPKDGKIENGAEMFGNLTPQPASDDPNGFLALAVYDLAANGGNGDGIIDARDAVYSRLRIWRDSNHNGVSEPAELIGMQQARIKSISLDYSESGRIDRFGNRFRFKSKVVSTDGSVRSAYDVILQFTKAAQARTVGGEPGLQASHIGRSIYTALVLCFAMVGILWLPRMRS